MHSEQTMGSRKHQITLLDEEKVSVADMLQAAAYADEQRPRSKSYLDSTLDRVLSDELTEGEGLLVRRSYEIKSSASATASHIRKGTMAGKHKYSTSSIFNAAVVPDPRRKSAWTVMVWRNV